LEKTQTIIDLFFKDHEARFAKETKRNYRAFLHKFFVKVNKLYDEVLAKDVRSWLSELAELELKPRSIRSRLAALKLLQVLLRRKSNHEGANQRYQGSEN